MKIRGHLKPLVLELLEEDDRTGSEIAEEIKDIIGKKPSYGSIYPLLKEMEGSGFVKSHKDGRKRIYTLTEGGREAKDKAENERNEIIKKVLEGLRTFQKIFPEEDVELSIQNLERIKESREVNYPEIFRIVNILLSSDFDEEESQEVREILKDTIQRLEDV